jgi:uncharacterized membrane protein YozB (DUF420 family)
MRYDVLAVYLALAVWAALLVVAVRRRSYGRFLGFGVVVLLALNVRYFIEGQSKAIAFFVGIYDVFDNLGLSASRSAPALARCLGNTCTVWGDRYVNHPSWGVAFYQRFANGPRLRKSLLYGHIFFNTAAFVLMHVQLLRPGTGGNRVRHRRIGRVAFASVTLGTISAVWLAAEHGRVSEYGGNLSMVGFWSMSAFVYLCAVMGVVTVRRGDTAGHRRWMIRYAGSMWGSFWLFRVMLVVTGPLLRHFETASLLISIWFSAPLGILIAEVGQRRSRRRVSAEPRTAAIADPLVATGD